LASIINKLPMDNFIRDFIKNTVEVDLYNLIQDEKNDISARQVYVDLYTWIVKALIVRGEPEGSILWNKMQNLLESCNIEIATHLSSRYHILFEDIRTLVNKKPLYKQKYFVINLPELLKSYQESKRPHIYLIAISNLLKNLPTSVLLDELHNILPLLLNALNVQENQDANLLLSTLNTFMMLVKEVPITIANHLKELIPQLLKISCDNRDARVRLISLQCISELSHLSVELISPYMKSIVRGLKPVLDDKKRLVRKMAVKARNEWYVVIK